jgi:hypothetical protein
MSRGHGKAAEVASLGFTREYWTGILVGYLAAAVLTSFCLTLAFVRQGF